VLKDLRTWLAGEDGGFERAIEFLHAPGRLLAGPAPDDELRATSLAAMRACGRAVVQRDFETCHDFDLRGRLSTVTAPALALLGEHDGLTPRRFHEELVDGIDGAELAVVEDAGHLVMLERPEAFNAALREFLQRRVD
jgi:pimeloyl-ACP methyl ester carboxylesterase